MLACLPLISPRRFTSPRTSNCAPSPISRATGSWPCCAFEPATITQIAERVGLAKGSSSYHVRLLERAGLVKVVRTRKVRGVTERYYAMAARTIALPDPGEGGPDVLMRHAVADLEASPVDGERHVRMAHLRLTEEQFGQLGARLQALADEYRELSDPSLPDASLIFALFHPARRQPSEEGAK